MINHREIEKLDSCEISAWFVCKILNVEYSHSSIAGDSLLIPDHHLNLKLPFGGIVGQLFSTVRDEITEAKLQKIKAEFRWREEDESIKSLDLKTLIFCELDQDAHDAVYAAERLLYSLMNISEEDWFEEARNFTDIKTLSWAQTASFKYQLDELANIIDDYNECPLKCRELEYEILRLFAYIYANTACYDFFTTQPAFAFNWDSELTMLQLEREDFVIARARVHDKKKYLKKKEFLIFKLLEILIYPFLIFSLFWWHFDFSSWNTPELYLSLLASCVCEQFLACHNDSQYPFQYPSLSTLLVKLNTAI